MKNKLKKLTLLLASSLTVMAAAAIAPALPKMAIVFSDIPEAVILSKLILTIPALFIAIFGMVIGIMLTKIGRIKVLFYSLLLYALAGASGFYLDDIYSILIGRAFLGIAVAGIMTSVATLIGDYFVGEERNQFTGLQSMFMALGGVAFVILGGVLADIDWKIPFLTYLFSFVVLILSVFSLDEPVAKGDSMDGTNTQDFPKPIVSLILLTTFITMVVFYMTPVQVPFLLKGISINSSKLSGLAISCFTIGGAITSGLYAKVKKKFSYIRIYVIAFAVLSLGYIALGYVQNYYLIIFCLFLSGIGGGFLLPNSTVWLLSVVPDKVRGVFMGLLTTVLFLGQFMSPILVQPLIKIGGLSLAFTGVGCIALFISFIFLMFSRKIAPSSCNRRPTAIVK